jgi:hypothetical protein
LRDYGYTERVVGKVATNAGSLREDKEKWRLCCNMIHSARMSVGEEDIDMLYLYSESNLSLLVLS